MTTDYDVVVIGGGHNGLVAAAYLAKEGRSVLVVESRDELGGTAATEETFPGFRIDIGAGHVGLLQRRIIQELGLNVELLESPIAALNLAEGDTLRLWGDEDRSKEEIARFSTEDAGRYREFLAWIAKQASVLKDAMDQVPPRYSRDGLLRELPALLPWAKVALRLRRNGRMAVTDFLRAIPMSAEQMLEEWFETPVLIGALAASGVEGSMQGPKASGTGLMLLYQALNGLPTPVRYVRGGTGVLSDAIAEAAKSRGAEILSGVGVERLLINENRVRGVVLSDGREIRCAAVASSANPRHTLLDLVGAPNLELRVVRRTRNLRFRGSTAKINLALSGIPGFRHIEDSSELTGRILVCPSTDYLERAYDDAKYHEWSRSPYLDMVIPTLMDPTRAPEGKHILAVTVRYAPYRLENRDWDEDRELFGDHVVAAVADYAPDLPELILHRQIITPLDYERELNLAEGSIYHGQMAIDQLLTMRPIPGFGRYKAPVGGLYFCGSGAHPGGGVTGLPGRNAARVIAGDIK